MSATATEPNVLRAAPAPPALVTRMLDLAADGLLPPWVEPAPCAAADGAALRVTVWAAVLAGAMAVGGLVLALSVG